MDFCIIVDCLTYLHCFPTKRLFELGTARREHTVPMCDLESSASSPQDLPPDLFRQQLSHEQVSHDHLSPSFTSPYHVADAGGVDINSHYPFSPPASQSESWDDKIFCPQPPSTLIAQNSFVAQGFLQGSDIFSVSLMNHFCLCELKGSLF